MNEKQHIFEVINAFKNLASKFKKDNDEIKVLVENKDVTIAACKKEYQKLYLQHEELKKKFAELENYFQQQQQQQKQGGCFPIKRQLQPQINQKTKKKRYIIEEDDDDNDNDYDDKNDNESVDIENEDDENNVEYIKVKKKNQKEPNQNKKKKNSKIPKGIIDYINN